MIGFRHVDDRFPFLWETDRQPPGRWHGEGDGPVHYLADTPDGAWAEFLRHEEIREPDDVATIRRGLWATEVDDAPAARPRLPFDVLTGGLSTYPACRTEAGRLRAKGATALIAPSAALLPGAARGWRVDRGMRPGRARSGRVLVLIGPRPDVVGWAATTAGRPFTQLLSQVRHF